MNQKVLVGIITHAKQRYCRDQFIDFLGSLTHPYLDFLFVTNSGEADRLDLQHRTRSLKATGRQIMVVNSSPTSLKKMDIIVANRNVVRKQFLEGDWEWLFVIDSDIMGPPDTLEALLQHGQPLVTGACLGIFTGDDSEAVVRPTLFGFDKPGTVRQLLISETLPPQLFKVALAGFGCCLIRRDVIEHVRHRKMSDRGGEDTAFFKDARKLGYDVWCDTRVKCRHQKYPTCDKRNDMLDLSLYRFIAEAQTS